MACGGGNPTPIALVAAGRAHDTTCRLCGAVLADMVHRRFVCPAWWIHRRQHLSTKTTSMVGTYIREGNHTIMKMFARGMIPRPRDLAPKPLRSVDAEGRLWINRPASGKLFGILFTDGSAIRPDSAVSRRAGWGIVMVDREGNELAAVYGAVPTWAGPLQLARDAEDFCFWVLPRCSENVEAVYVDCAGTVGCAQDRRKALSPRNPRAGLWHDYWDTMGPSTLVVKTRAHTTVSEAREGIVTTLWEHHANKAADGRAKLGASLHPWTPDAAEDLESHWELALELASWAGWQEAAASALPDAIETINAEERAVRRAAQAERRQAAGLLEVAREEPDDRSAIATARKFLDEGSWSPAEVSRARERQSDTSSEWVFRW